MCKECVCCSCGKAGVCRHDDTDSLQMLFMAANGLGCQFMQKVGVRVIVCGSNIRCNYSQAVIRSSLQCQDFYKLCQVAAAMDITGYILVSNAVLLC